MQKILLIAIESFFLLIGSLQTAETPALTALTGHTNYVCYAAFSPNGKTIITASWDKTACNLGFGTGTTSDHQRFLALPL